MRLAPCPFGFCRHSVATENTVMKCSVALCTYNGERYIAEQLQSYLTQSVLPDELIVCDDGSTDGTIDIVQEFVRQAPFRVGFFRNVVNLGSTKNFEKAASLCCGDIIFLSDQDDVWSPGKIEAMVAAFDCSNIVAAFSNARIIDGDNQDLGYGLWDAIHFDNQQQRMVRQGRSFEALLRHNVVTGATLAFRRSQLGAVLPIPCEWIHDAWIALLLAARGRLVAINRPYIDYRQHGANQVGARKRSVVDRVNEIRTKRVLARQYLDESMRYRQAQQRLGSFLSAIQRSQIDEKIQHLENRSGLRRRRLSRVPVVIKEAISGRYRRCAYGWWSAANDFIYEHVEINRASSV